MRAEVLRAHRRFLLAPSKLRARIRMNSGFTFSWPTCAQAHPTVDSHIPLPRAKRRQAGKPGLTKAWKNAKASTPAVSPRGEQSSGSVQHRLSTPSSTFPSKHAKAKALLKRKFTERIREGLGIFFFFKPSWCRV